MPLVRATPEQQMFARRAQGAAPTLMRLLGSTPVTAGVGEAAAQRMEAPEQPVDWGDVITSALTAGIPLGAVLEMVPREVWTKLANMGKRAMRTGRATEVAVARGERIGQAQVPGRGRFYTAFDKAEDLNRRAGGYSRPGPVSGSRIERGLLHADNPLVLHGDTPERAAQSILPDLSPKDAKRLGELAHEAWSGVIDAEGHWLMFDRMMHRFAKSRGHDAIFYPDMGEAVMLEAVK